MFLREVRRLAVQQVPTTPRDGKKATNTRLTQLASILWNLATGTPYTVVNPETEAIETHNLRPQAWAAQLLIDFLSSDEASESGAHDPEELARSLRTRVSDLNSLADTKSA